MNISLNIVFSSQRNITHDISEKTFIITFNSFEEYQKFLKKPSKFLINEWDDPNSKKVYNLINNNLEKFAELLKKQSIFVSGVTPTSNIPLDIAQHLEIDLKELSLEDEIKLLNERSWDNVAFLDKYNTMHLATKEELLQTYKQVYKMASKYKKYNLSPLEITLIAFNLVRERTYIENEKDKARSRDLSYILENPEIVCLGYVRLFRCFCEILGVKTETLTWLNNYNTLKNGHASALAYINDSKYDIQGLFAFEPTWSAIKPRTKESYMNDYRFALQPLSIEISQKMARNLDLSSDNILCLMNNNLKLLESLIELDSPQKIIDKSKKLLLGRINNIREMIGKEPRTMPRENDVDEFKKMIEVLKIPLFNNISLEKFKRLIERVRIIENEINPKTYKNDKETIDNIVASRASFYQNDSLNNLIEALFGDSRIRKKS